MKLTPSPLPHLLTSPWLPGQSSSTSVQWSVSLLIRDGDPREETHHSITAACHPESQSVIKFEF